MFPLGSNIQGVSTGCILPIVYCYLEFKLCCHKNLKLLSIRVKELFEPIVCKEKKATDFSSFKAFSRETAL